jgi:hypothetical protein
MESRMALRGEPSVTFDVMPAGDENEHEAADIVCNEVDYRHAARRKVTGDLARPQTGGARL